MQKKNGKNLIYTLLLIQIVMILSSVFIVLRTLDTQRLNNKIQNSKLVFSIVSNEFGRILKQSEVDLKKWAEELESKESSNACETPTALRYQFSEIYSNYAYVDKEGNFVCSLLPFHPEETFKSRIKEFEDFKSDNDFRVTDFGIGANGKPRVVAWYPLFDSENKFNGGVALGISLIPINEFFSNLDLPQDSEILITDSTGAVEVIYPRDDSLLGERKFSVEIFNAILTRDTGDRTMNGKLYIHEPLEFNDDFLSYIIYSAPLKGHLDIYQSQYLLFLAFFLIGISLIADIVIVKRIYSCKEK